MTMNTWELSVSLVNMCDLAYGYAKHANIAKLKECDSMYEVYNDYIYGIKRALQCIKGFDLCTRKDYKGYFTKLYITYNGNVCGDKWEVFFD